MSFSRTGIAKDAVYYKRLDCDVNMEELCQGKRKSQIIMRKRSCRNL